MWPALAVLRTHVDAVERSLLQVVVLTAAGATSVLGVTATGQTLDAALARCYDSAARIHWDGLHYRRDIGRFR